MVQDTDVKARLLKIPALVRVAPAARPPSLRRRRRDLFGKDRLRDVEEMILATRSFSALSFRRRDAVARRGGRGRQLVTNEEGDHRE